ncbi:MAG: DNA gyrase C-terminal beta-propeller domain-containing protein, partial [Bacteroidales bacterium]
GMITFESMEASDINEFTTVDIEIDNENDTIEAEVVTEVEGDATNDNETETVDQYSETIMVVSEQGYGKRSNISDYRKTNRGGKGVKTMSISDKTGKLVAIKNVTDDNDLMIINKSGITIRLKVADTRIMGRATQGVKLINLGKRNDQIASVCKVMTDVEEEIVAENPEQPVVSQTEEMNLNETSNDSVNENTENNEDNQMSLF